MREVVVYGHRQLEILLEIRISKIEENRNRKTFSKFRKFSVERMKIWGLFFTLDLD